MSYLFYLPVEHYLLLRELPNEVHSQLEVDPFTIKQISFVDLSKDIASQLGSLVPKLKTNETQKIKETHLTLLLLAEEYEEIEPYFEDQDHYGSIAELLIHQITTQKLYPVGKFDFDKDQFQNGTETEQILAQINHEFGNIYGGGPSEWNKQINAVIDKDPEFIHQHLVLMTSWIRVLSIALSSTPESLNRIVNKWMVLAKSLNAKQISAIMEHIMGMIRYSQSRPTIALRHYENSIDLSRQLGMDLYMASMNNIGLIHGLLGEFHKALSIYEELLEKNPNNITNKLNYIETLISLERYQEALEIANDIDYSEIPIANVLNTVHKIHVRLGDMEKAKKLENKGEELYEKNPVKANLGLWRSMQGRRHHAQGNLNLAKEKANENLQLAKDTGNLTIIFRNYVKLIEIQIDLLALRSNDLQTKNQLYSLINTLITLSDEQGMSQGSIEALMLRGEIFILDDNLEAAREDLYNAAKLAEEYDFDNLRSEAESKLQDVKIQIQSEQPGIEEENRGVFDRIKQATKKLLRLSTGGQYEKKTTEIHGLLIVSSEGMSIYDNYFSERLSSEPSLISGLISAVSAFITEIAQGKGFLKSIQHDDMSLILEPANNFVVVCIAEEETFEVRDKTREFSEQVNDPLDQYRNLLENGEVPRELDNELNRLTSSIYN